MGFFELTDLFGNKEVDKSLFKRKKNCACGSAGIIEILEEVKSTEKEKICSKCEGIITVEYATNLLELLHKPASRFVWCKERQQRIAYEVCNKGECNGCRDHEKAQSL